MPSWELFVVDTITELARYFTDELKGRLIDELDELYELDKLKELFDVERKLEKFLETA